MNTLRTAGRVVPLPLLFKLTGEQLFLPFYHVVSDEYLPHISHLYQYRNTRHFEADLDFLLKFYKPVNLQELKYLQDEKLLHAKPCMLLSFDDGLRECAEVIAPILLRKGIPAVFFINPPFIDNKGLMYRYKASLIINQIKKGISEPVKKRIYEILGIPATFNLEAAVLKINFLLKQKLDEIAEILEVNFAGFLLKERPYMTSAQVKEMIDDGFNIGGHSMEHPLFSLLSYNEQWEQAKKSMEEITRDYQQETQSFSFPFTDHGISAKLIQQMHRTGVDFTFGSAGLKQDFSYRHLQRFPMEGTNLPASALVKAEYLYYLLKKPLGKHGIDRHMESTDIRIIIKILILFIILCLTLFLLEYK